MRNKIIMMVLSVVLVVSLAIVGCAKPVAPPEEPADGVTPTPEPVEEPVEVRELIYQGSHPRPQYLVQTAFIPFAMRLGEESGGRLKVTYYDGGAIAPDALEGVVTNIINIGHYSPQSAPGMYPLGEVMGLPFIVPSSTVGGMVGTHLMETFPEWRAEYPPEVKVLHHFCSATYNLHMIDGFVKTAADLKGKTIIGIDAPGLELLELLGATPIGLAGGDWYLSLERGMADGILCPLAPIRAMKITDICKYHTIVNTNLFLFVVLINRGYYDSLPLDLQQMIDREAGMKGSELFGHGLDKGAVADCEWMKGEGHEFYVLPPEELAKWTEAIMPMREAWIANVEAKGLPGREVLDEVLRYAQELVEQGVYVPDYTVFE